MGAYQAEEAMAAEVEKGNEKHPAQRMLTQRGELEWNRLKRLRAGDAERHPCRHQIYPWPKQHPSMKIQIPSRALLPLAYDDAP